MQSQVHQILDSSSDTNDSDISDSDHSFEEVDGNVLNFSWEISSSCSSNEAVLTDEQEEDSESDDDTESEYQSPPPCPLIVEPSQVLEPCHFIVKECGPRRECFGYRLCGDNIDKTVKTRYMRSDKHNLSLHYFHSYAVLNRVDASSLSDIVPDISQLDTEVVANTLLPSVSDDLVLRNNITTIISRVLVSHLEYFKFAFEDTVNWHIKHKFYGEMSQKSIVVSKKTLIEGYLFMLYNLSYVLILFYLLICHI